MHRFNTDMWFLFGITEETEKWIMCSVSGGILGVRVVEIKSLS